MSVCAVPETTDHLTPEVNAELRRIAYRHLSRERGNHTLQPTALVHEAYLKLAGGRDHSFKDQVHLLAVASRVMRQVLVDYARSRGARKRSWEDAPESREPELTELINLDDALADLAEQNAIFAQLIEMRFFGGMTAEECAEALGMSVHVVRHDLRYAQAWLRNRLSR